MARLLSCPHCHAEFGFEEWAKAASCPACGRRVSFFEASGQAASQSVSSAPAETGVPSASRASAGTGAWDPLPDMDAAPEPATAPEPAAADRPAPGVGDLREVTGSGAGQVAGKANGATGPGAARTVGEDGGPDAALGGWTWSAPESAPAAADDGVPPRAVFSPPTDVASAVAGTPPPAAVPAPSTAASLPSDAAPPPSAVVPPSDAAPPPSDAVPPSFAAVPRPASFSAGSSGSRGRVYTIGGKALAWSPGWTVVLVVWAIVAASLVAIRVDMGRLTVMTRGETAAIAAVKQIKLLTGAPTETVLRYSATHDLNLEGHLVQIKPKKAQMWYAFDRSWEHRTYVYYELPGTSLVGTNVVLSWSVTDGVATADGSTRLALAKAARTMAHPPSSNSVRAVPGIIPSLPPDLQ